MNATAGGPHAAACPVEDCRYVAAGECRAWVSERLSEHLRDAHEPQAESRR